MVMMSFVRVILCSGGSGVSCVVILCGVPWMSMVPSSSIRFLLRASRYFLFSSSCFWAKSWSMSMSAPRGVLTMMVPGLNSMSKLRAALLRLVITRTVLPSMVMLCLFPAIL